jgi:hypothetical protein
MKIVVLLVISSVLGGSAHAAKHQRYIRDVEAIAKTNQKRIQRYQQNPPASVTQREAAAYENLVELDLYLLNREVRMYQHSLSTKMQVDAKLAQLSRDMEDAPETHHETAQSRSMNARK